MRFEFTRSRLTPAEQARERLFEALPGATSWTILIGMLVLGWWKPLIAAVLIIAFDLYWLLRLFYLTVFLVLSSWRLALERGTDWMARLQALEVGGGVEPSPPRNARQRLSWWLHRRRVRALQRLGAGIPSWREITHVVIIPIIKEGRAVVEPGIASLARQTFPARQILIVLAVEERAERDIKREAEDLQAAYRQRFLDFLLVVHPDGLPGEARVKGANATYAAKAAAAHLTARGIAFERTIVSCFDADTVVTADYVACLTAHFLLCPERTRASFQPIPVYHNNIWEVPACARVLDIGSSFFQLIEATHPEGLVTFSSHSMSFQALVDVGFWPVDLISDDSAIFWKAFIHYDGRYRVVPLYITLSMDVVAARTWWRTAVNVYRQKRRWAWGVENFPIVLRAFLSARAIRLRDRVRHGFKLFEGHVTWATSAFLLTIIGWLPALFAGREFSDTVLYYSAPRITGTIFRLASLAFLTSIILSLCLLPKPRSRLPLLRHLGLAGEWLLIPFIATFLSALPALDAQTRLLRGRYMEFWVTEKRRMVPQSSRRSPAGDRLSRVV